MNCRFFCYILLFLIGSCSGNNEDEGESILDDTPHEVAEKAVTAMNTPLDKARNAATVSEQHNRNIEEAVQKANEKE